MRFIMEHSRSDWLKAYLHGKGTAPVHTMLGAQPELQA